MERMGKIRVGVTLLLLVVQGAGLTRTASSNPFSQPSNEASSIDAQTPTTYQKFLPLALDDDPDTQYLLGFMFLHGEGVEGDYDQAHQWFHLAAEGGHKVAQRVLGNLHARVPSRVPDYFYDPAESRHWLNRITAPMTATTETGPASAMPPISGKRGEAIYTHHCAACHGLDGNAHFPGAPSFSRGERLHKNPSELNHSIVNGKGLMPAWGASLPGERAGEVLSYLQERWGATAPPPNLSSDSGTALTQAVKEGEGVFTAFCAGCHGLNGIAYYVDSPSFALGEQLHKSDEALLQAIKAGIGEMPDWENKLSERQLRAVLTFIRTLAPAYAAGISGESRQPAKTYFVFKTVKKKGGKSPPPPAPVNETATR